MWGLVQGEGASPEGGVVPPVDAGSDRSGTWDQWAGVDALDADAPLKGRQGTESPAWRGGEGSDGAGGEPAAGWPGLLEQGDEAGLGAAGVLGALGLPVGGGPEGDGSPAAGPVIPPVEFLMNLGTPAATDAETRRGVADYDWFDWPHRPPRLAESRPYDAPGGLARPDPQVEQDLVLAVEPGVRFPDPRGTWVRLINGGGPADDPFRASNAADCALSVLSTWHGEPAAAAPRTPGYDAIGRPLLTGETGSTARMERWAGQRFQYAGQGRHAYPMLAHRLREAGHGASAIIVVRWPAGGSHAWNAVNYQDEIIWIDAQRGHMAVEPLYTTVTGVFCIILDRQGQPR